MLEVVINTQNKQRGAALFVALMILVVVSLLGISSMKSSVFSAKVSTVTQADALTFEAAETALNLAYVELNAMAGEDLYALMADGSLVTRCVTKADTKKEGDCGNADYMGTRSMLKASSSSKLDGYELISGSQVSSSGGGMIFVDYKLAMLGESQMASFNLDNYHIQEALKRGIKPGSEIE